VFPAAVLLELLLADCVEASDSPRLLLDSLRLLDDDGSLSPRLLLVDWLELLLLVFPATVLDDDDEPDCVDASDSSRLLLESLRLLDDEPSDSPRLLDESLRLLDDEPSDSPRLLLLDSDVEELDVFPAAVLDDDDDVDWLDTSDSPRLLDDLLPDDSLDPSDSPRLLLVDWLDDEDDVLPAAVLLDELDADTLDTSLSPRLLLDSLPLLWLDPSDSPRLLVESEDEDEEDDVLPDSKVLELDWLLLVDSLSGTSLAVA